MKTFKQFFAVILALLLMVTVMPPLALQAITETVVDLIPQKSDSSVTIDTDSEAIITTPLVKPMLYATATSDEILLAEDGAITRAEWLHNLVVIFDMTVESTALPDNYFTDIDESHEYYDDVLLAVEFGVVDIDAGGELDPDGYVTRDFAASTLNFCLGYLLDEDVVYTFTDSAECLDPDSAQVAVDRNWFALISGNFSPATLVTESEVEFMLDDAIEVLSKTVVDATYTSTFEFEDDIIVIPDGTEVTEDEDGTVHITNCSQTINSSDRFAVYYNGIPSVYTADTVSTENSVTTITTTKVESDDAFVSVDAQGVADAESMEITPVEGVDVSFEEDNSGISTFSTKKLKSINAKTELELFPGVTADVSVKIKSPEIEYSVSSSYAYVLLQGDTEISYSVEANLVEMAFGNKAIELFNVSVLGIGNFTVSVEFELSGAASGEVEGYLVAGLECTKGGKLRAIKSFQQKQYSSNVEATASVGLKVTLGITKMPVISAYIYAEAGVKANLKSTTYKDDKEPNKCVHFAAYLYVKYGASASAKFGGWKTSLSVNYDIFNDKNSPVKIVHHYENGVLVPSCTRGTDYTNFFTKASSRWGGSGWISANGAYGLNADGTYFALYNYTLNDKNEATITKYNGNSWSVYIPKEIDGYTVVAIGNKAFQNKDARNIIISETVSSIDSYAFSGCYNLRKIEIPYLVTTISAGTFQNCSSLESVIIPEAVTTIYRYAFDYCTSLRSIELPKSLTTLYNGAFRYCDSLTYVYIPKNVTIESSISNDGPFIWCSNIKNVVFEDGITSIPSELFSYCDGIESIAIPNTVTSIRGYAFYKCSNLETVTIPNSVTTIGAYAFAECTNIKEVVLPDSLTTIGICAFNSCTNLKKINLPKSLTTLNYGAFGNCDLITEIFIPKNLTINSSLSELGPFDSCDGLKTVVFEDGITTIPNNLFAYCDGIESITIPNTVSKINGHAFYCCDNLKSVTISDSVTSIGAYAFAQCQSLEDIVLPESVSSLGMYAFNKCVALKKINIPNGVVVIPRNTFSGCSSLNYVKLSENIHTIKSYAFSECSSLESISLPKKITEIEAGVFQNCTTLKKIELPQSIRTMDSYVFMGCDLLSEVIIPDYSIKTIQTATFKDCPSLVSIILPKGLTTIGSQAFMNDTSLVNVTIPESVTSIDSTAFSYPAKTTVYGKTGSYAETFANNGGFTFKDNSISVEGIILKDGVENVTLDAGETYRAEFEVYPEDANDVITLTANNSNVTINGHDIYAKYAGDTVITATSTSGLTYQFNVHIRSIKGIEVITNPTKTTYIMGEEFDKAGMVVQVNYYDGSSKIVDDYTISGFDSSVEGSNILSIKWASQNYSTYSTTITVNIVDPTPKLTGIFIEALPTKLNYELREKLDTTGLVVKGTYIDNSTKEITDYTISGYNALKSGIQIITVAYGDFTTTFTVTVGLSITGVEIASKPSKTSYYVDSEFEIGGLTLKVSYSDGSSKIIDSGFTTSGFDSSEAGEKTITVVYGGFSDTFTVTVREKGSATPGDVNDDGRINNKDLGLLMQYLNDWEITIVEEASDVNADGKINNKDYGLLMQYLNDWDVEFK